MMETNAHSKSIQQITNNHQAMLEFPPRNCSRTRICKLSREYIEVVFCL